MSNIALPAHVINHSNSSTIMHDIEQALQQNHIQFPSNIVNDIQHIDVSRLNEVPATLKQRVVSILTNKFTYLSASALGMLGTIIAYVARKW